ncbi:unnamed protein product [Clonostachys byssicola]|uniref:Uncharacterized protein n=1 Tax=Clonostachys byssicola TaxID=160290 RepID=A0A9N9U3A2_9HYPO|nr:unnamed protein product [Clonostachys byssicola]
MILQRQTLRRLATIQQKPLIWDAAPIQTSICRRCRERSFATTARLEAGHNKWSKTKHIKAVTDKKKMIDRTNFVKVITMYSRMYGENLQFNPQLAGAIAAATKASVPKSIIEGAVARGQGRSTSGAQLEPMTLEALIAPNIAIIAEAETDNKIRTISDLKLVAKRCGAVASASAFYFTKRGRTIFKAKEGGPTLSEVLEEAIEHEGVEDIEELPEGGFVTWTEPAMLTSVTEVLSRKFGLELMESDIIWAPNEDTMVDMESPATALNLGDLLSGFKDFPEVKAIYVNVRQGSLSDEVWEKVNGYLDI